MDFNDAKWEVAEAIAGHLAQGFSRCGVEGCHGRPTTWSFGCEDSCARGVADFDRGIMTRAWNTEDGYAVSVDEEVFGWIESGSKW